MNEEYLPCGHCHGTGMDVKSEVFTGEECERCKGTGYFKQPNVQKEINRNEVLNEIQNKLINQTQKGLEKYGHTVQVNSLSTIEWVDHAIEETIDKLVYLTCIKKSLESEGNELNKTI